MEKILFLATFNFDLLKKHFQEDCMELREKIKKEIDLLPEEHLHQIEEYLKLIKRNKQHKKSIKTLHLKGKFDNLNLRKLAYE